MNRTKTARRAGIRYRYPEDIPFTLTDGTRVTIRAHLSTHGGRCGEPFTFTERRLVEFAFVQPLGITTILDRLMSFRWLLTLLVGKTVHLTKLTALLPECATPQAWRRASRCWVITSTTHHRRNRRMHR